MLCYLKVPELFRSHSCVVAEQSRESELEVITVLQKKDLKERKETRELFLVMKKTQSCLCL